MGSANLAPAPDGTTAHVYRQPNGEEELARALLAEGDVADHERWAQHFGCPRWIHAAAAAAAPGAEHQPRGEDPVTLDADLRLIPTPGHTAGSMVAKLRHLDVRWLLPGHGGRRAFAAGEWARQIDGLLAHHAV